MKFGIFVLAILMLALVALPLAPYSGSSGSVVQSADPPGEFHAYRNGPGMASLMSDGRSGMMRGPGATMPASRACPFNEPPAGSQVQQELRRDPFDWNTPARTIRFQAYRRLSGKNILEHEKRQLIYTTILMNPGIEIPLLSSLTGINLHTLRYHLGYLMSMNKIACIEQGGGYHFFENHGRYGQDEQQRILYSRYPTTSRILSVIGANPGITRGGLAGELGLAGPSVTRWTRQLIANGVVTEVRDGRRVHYYPVEVPPGSTGANA